MMNPHPLLSWQGRTPTLTPSALAVPPNARAAKATVAAPAARRNFMDIFIVDKLLVGGRFWASPLKTHSPGLEPMASVSGPTPKKRLALGQVPERRPLLITNGKPLHAPIAIN